MLINYVLSLLFLIMSFNLYRFAEDIKKAKPEKLIIPPNLVSWMYRFKISVCVAYLAGAVWQLMIPISGQEPVAPTWYLSFVLFLNVIIFANILQVRKHLKIEL